MLRRLLPCLLLCACSSRDASPQPGAKSTTTAPPAPVSALPGFKAQLDGNELPLQSVLAFSRGGAALQLTFSTVPLECEHLAGSGVMREPGEVSFDLTVAPLFGDKNGWAVTRAKLGRATRQGKLGDATVKKYDPREEVSLQFKASLLFPAAASSGANDQKLELDGSIAAKGCGLVPLSADAKVRPQDRLVLELDGKRVGVHGASLVRRRLGNLELRLSSEPHDCANGPLGSDLGVMIALSDQGDSAQSIALDGYAIPQYVPQVLEPGSVSVRFERTPLEADGAAEVSGDIAGEVTVKNHRLRVQGTAAFEVCP
jgi:hypothetical protein